MLSLRSTLTSLSKTNKNTFSTSSVNRNSFALQKKSTRSASGGVTKEQKKAAKGKSVSASAIEESSNKISKIKVANPSVVLETAKGEVSKIVENEISDIKNTIEQDDRNDRIKKYISSVGLKYENEDDLSILYDASKENVELKIRISKEDTTPEEDENEESEEYEEGEDGVDVKRAGSDDPASKYKLVRPFEVLVKFKDSSKSLVFQCESEGDDKLAILSMVISPSGFQYSKPDGGAAEGVSTMSYFNFAEDSQYAIEDMLAKIGIHEDTAVFAKWAFEHNLAQKDMSFLKQMADILKSQ
eukprot:TRINITY_DN3556_c0_g1_i1.p1 TRINITY_DN3556_c0_g1~~TRINITY_DN3556_c0_g1_i1.p1  ORF type:complete len:300 (-),score=97.00 TRINITY_DN3556_c0_g1_i1:72-971(-)